MLYVVLEISSNICVTCTGPLVQIPVKFIIKTFSFKVSSSEQGGAGGPTENNGVLIDWSHLEATYESCISATEDAPVDDLQRLHSAITALIHKHMSNPNKMQLLQVGVDAKLMINV